MAEPVERLLAELSEAVLGLGRSPRIRLAVTADEYQRIRERILAQDGKFYGRVRNVVLVVDEEAAKPRFWFETADGA
jgi:hypothetical protein